VPSLLRARRPAHPRASGLGVDRDQLDFFGAEPEVAQRADRGDCALRRRRSRGLRGAAAALRLDVPPGAPQHLVTRGARHVKFAMWQPVTNRRSARGRPSSSRIQPETTSSITAAAGDMT
jgi:hypothetical protein